MLRFFHQVEGLKYFLYFVNNCLPINATPVHQVISMDITSIVTEIPFCTVVRGRNGTTKINPNKIQETTIRIKAIIMSTLGFCTVRPVYC